MRPETSKWGGASKAIEEYVAEQEQHHRQALGLDNLIAQAATEVSPGNAKQEEPHV